MKMGTRGPQNFMTPVLTTTRDRRLAQACRRPKLPTNQVQSLTLRLLKSWNGESSRGSVKPRLSADLCYRPSVHRLSTYILRTFTRLYRKFTNMIRSSVYARRLDQRFYARLKLPGRLNLLLQLKYKGKKGIEWCWTNLNGRNMAYWMVVNREGWRLATAPNLILDTWLTFIQIRRKETVLIWTPESIAEVNISMYIMSLSIIKCIVYNGVMIIHSSFSLYLSNAA